MQRVISNRINPLLIFTMMLAMVSFSGTGCQDAHAEEGHEETAECTAVHNHETEEEHNALQEDHTGHEHEGEEQEEGEHSDEVDHTGHNHPIEEPHGVEDDDEDDEDHTGHEHEGEEEVEMEEEGDAALVLSQRNIEAAGIVVAVAGPGNVDQQAQLLGEISMNNNQMFHIVPPVTGTVQEIRVQVGDQVNEGDVLAVLSSRDLADARSEFLSARSSYTLAQTIYSNQQELFDASFLSEQDFLISREEYTRTQIEYQATRQSLSNLGLSEYQINRISSSNMLTRQELCAPISGTVVHLDFAPGEIVGDETTVLTVADLSTVWVELDVLQTDIGSVRAGQTVIVSASEIAIPEETTVLDFVSPVISRSTRTASARAELQNPNGYWMPGLFVSAQVTTSESEASVVVNREAVQTLDGETVIFVPHEGAFETIPVQLGLSNRTQVEIQSGLLPGEEYVSLGAFALKAEIVTSGLDSHAGHGH